MADSWIGPAQFGTPTGRAHVTGGGTPAGTNGFKFDLTGLTDLQKQLKIIISQFDELDGKIRGVNGGLGGMGRVSGAGGANLTTAAVTAINPASGRTAASTATFGGQSGGGNVMGPGAASSSQQGPGGPLNTSAMFGGRSMAYLAGGEIMAQAGGWVNSKMAAIGAGGVPGQLAAAQMATINGGTTFGNISAFGGVLTSGQPDQAQAMNMMLQNNFLSTLPTHGKNWNNFKGFLNAATKLGGMSATASMQLAQNLTSNQALQTFQNMAGGRAGLMTRNAQGQLQINSAENAFRSTLQAAIPGALGLSGKRLTNRITGAATNDWQSIAQTLQQRFNLSPSEVALFHEVAMKGGNVPTATGGPINQTKAAALIEKTTAQTNLQNSLMQTTSGVQNALLKVQGALNQFARFLNMKFPLVSQAGALGASIGGTALGLGGNYMMAKTLMRGFGRGGIGGAGGGITGEGLGAGGGLLGGAGEGMGGAALGGMGMLGAVAAGAGIPLIGASILNHYFGGHGNISAALAQKAGGLKKVITGLQGEGFNTSQSQIQSMYANYNSTVGDPVGTSGMQPNLAHGLTAMQAANPKIKINSGYRTQTQQAALYAMKGGHGVARPGHSPHQLGKAADIGPPSQFGWISANASKYGLAADRSEPWHVQAMGDPNTASSITGSQVVAGAQTQLGVNYVYGGETAGKAMDCSGLVQYVYGQLGISLPRTTYQQVKCGSPVAGLAKAQPGDLIFYAGSDGTASNPGHVAIYIGGGNQIAAPHTGTKVQVQPVQTSAVVAIRRIVGGGAGKGVVAAAQGAVGMSSNDSSNHGTGSTATPASSPSGLTNTFISSLSGSWLSGGMGGGGTGGSSTVMSSAGGSVGGSTTTATTGSTAIVGGAGGSISSPTGFSKAILAGLGLAATAADVGSLNAWQQQEGQWGAKGVYNAMQMHDPLNTNLPEKGGHSLNGTWFYPDWATGVAATVATIKQGNMANIYKALQANDNLASFSAAAESTPWAASAYGGRSWSAGSGVYAVGDPVGGFSPMSGSSGGGAAGPVSAMRAGNGGRGVSVNIGPIYVQGTQADAQNIANMVSSAIKGNKDIQMVAGQ
jgi:peptidoglycan DL-endopeptidase CwlO